MASKPFVTFSFHAGVVLSARIDVIESWSSAYLPIPPGGAHHTKALVVHTTPGWRAPRTHLPYPVLTGELFAQAPVDQFPGTAVESVTDSSRYFVVRIEDGNGMHGSGGLF